MIFLSGAAGKTGLAILRALSQSGADVVPLARSDKQAAAIRETGVFNPIIGDLRDLSTIENKIKSAAIIYYICPNIAPDELEIGKNLIHLAHQLNIPRFVYHSVLHPQIQAMPHHWQKMRMEEALFESGLDFTILQPCAYMQNILGGWDSIKSGIYGTPYKTSSRISIVDLEDVAEAVAAILTQEGHSNAVYELAGPEPLSQVEVAQTLTKVLGYSIKAVEQSREEWHQNALNKGMPEAQASILLKMFEYYDKNGFVGNPNVLQSLLGRAPASFSQFVQRILAIGELV